MRSFTGSHSNDAGKDVDVDVVHRVLLSDIGGISTPWIAADVSSTRLNWPSEFELLAHTSILHLHHHS